MKHLPPSVATSRGHQRSIQQNLRSTKRVLPPIPLATSLDIAPSSLSGNPRTHLAFTQLVDMKIFSQSYSDQTGRFPVQSSRGNNYIFIMYDFDSNAILSVALPDRRGSSINHAWMKIFTKLSNNGYRPTLHILDNECSHDLKRSFAKNNVDFQRVPPHQHRRNAAERAIQTWKNHFISGLSSTDPSFPLTAWDHLLPQCDITLNLLRSSRRQPNLSAHACLFGNFDFNRTPLAVPGTRVIIHETSDQRPTFAPHGTDGFYVGPSLEHYRCYKVFVPATQSLRDSVTVEWFPSSVPFPKVGQDEYLRQTADDLLTLLENQPQASVYPSLQFGSPTKNAYVEIARILKRLTSPTDPAPSPSLVPPVDAPRVWPASASFDGTSPLLPRSTTPVIPPMPPLPRPPPTPLSLQRPARQSLLNTPRPALASPRVLLPPEPLLPDSTPRVNTPRPVTKAPTAPDNTPRAVPSVSRVPAPTSSPSAIPIALPRRYPRRLRKPTSRFGFAAQTLGDQSFQKKFQHHLAAIATTPALPVQEKAPKLPSLATLLKGPDRDVWLRGAANELGRLLPNGVGKSRPLPERIEGTGTIVPIRKATIPAGRHATYVNFVCVIRPQKAETHRVRMTFGGDRLDYPGDPSSPATSMLTTKIHLNSTISDAKNGARYLNLDIKNFFLGSHMDYFQYARVHASLIPTEIFNEYPSLVVEPDGFVYFEARKGIYGLKEASLLAFKQLVTNLKPFGYEPCPFTPGLWHHTTRRTTFTLCVDDFGVKYFSPDDANHLIQAL